MNPIDTYITKKLIAWVMISLVCASFLFFATQAFRLAPLFLGAELSGSLLLAFIWVQVPVLGWALSPAVAVAIFAVAGGMAQRGELLAADSVGITRFRLVRWPLVLTAFLSFVSVWLWVFAAPQSQRRLQQFAKVSIASAIVGSIPSGQFVEPIDGMVFFAEQKKGPGNFRNVTLKRTENEKTQLLAASEAKMSVEKGTSFIRIKLREGALFNVLDVGEEITVLHFGELESKMSIARELESKMSFLPHIMTLSTAALQTKVNTPNAANRYSFELYRRFAKPLEFLLLALISIALAFGIRWEKRAASFGGALFLFVLMHLLTRGAEVWMLRDNIGPDSAAFFSSIVLGIGGGGLGGYRVFKKRFNSL